MTTVRLLLAFALSLLALPVAAQTIDITGSQFEVRSPDTLRLRNVTVTGFPGKYFADIQWNGAGAFVPVAAGPETSPPFYDKTLLIKGKWHFVYTIGTFVFTDDYTLNNIDGTTNSQGGYWISGTDQFGGLVLAGYWPNDNNWTMLDPSSILDKFYVFTTDGQTITGCYRQILHSNGSISNCYPLTGTRTGPADAFADVAPDSIVDADHARRQAAEPALIAADAAPIDMTAMEKYWIMRGLMGTQP